MIVSLIIINVCFAVCPLHHVRAANRVRRDDLLSRPWTRSTPQSGPFMNIVHGDGNTRVTSLSSNAYASVNCLWLLKHHRSTRNREAYFTDYCGERLEVREVLPVLTDGELKAIRENKDVVLNTEQQHRILNRLSRGKVAGSVETSGIFGGSKRTENPAPSGGNLFRVKRAQSDAQFLSNYVLHNDRAGVNAPNGQPCRVQDCLGVLTYHKPSPQFPQGHFTDFCTNMVPAQAVLAPGQIPGRGSSVPRQGSLITQREIAKLADGKGIFLDAYRQTALATVLRRAGRPPVGGLFGGNTGLGGLFGGRKKRSVSTGSLLSDDRINANRQKRQVQLCPRQPCLGWLVYHQPDATNPQGYFTDWCHRVIPSQMLLPNGEIPGQGDPNPGPGSFLTKGHMEILAKDDPILIDTCRQTALATALARKGYGSPPSQFNVPFALSSLVGRRRKRQLGGLFGAGGQSRTNPFLPQSLPINNYPVITSSTPLCGPFANVVHNSRQPFPCLRPGDQKNGDNCLRTLRLVGQGRTDPNRYYVDACGRKIDKEVVEGGLSTTTTTTADPGIDQRTLDFTKPPEETTEATTEEETTETESAETTEEDTTPQPTRKPKKKVTRKPKRKKGVIKAGGAELSSAELRHLLLKGKAPSISRKELKRRRG